VETSKFLRADLYSDDPVRLIAGQFVVSDSQQALALITARGHR
jgi:hypothetical protein